MRSSGLERGPAAFEALLADDRVGAVSLTAYEPAADPEGRLPPIAAGLLRAVSAAVSARSR